MQPVTILLFPSTPFSTSLWPQSLTPYLVLQQIDERIKEAEDDIQEVSLDELKISKITKEIKDKLGNSSTSPHI